MLPTTLLALLTCHALRRKVGEAVGALRPGVRWPQVLSPFALLNVSCIIRRLTKPSQTDTLHPLMKKSGLQP